MGVVNVWLTKSFKNIIVVKILFAQQIFIDHIELMNVLKSVLLIKQVKIFFNIH